MGDTNWCLTSFTMLSANLVVGDIVDIGNEEDVEQEESVSAGNTGIPPLDKLLDQHIMNLLQGLVGLGILLVGQASQLPTNFPATATPKGDVTIGND